MKILLVDDSSTIRNILKVILSNLGQHEFLEASDGLKALKSMETERPDLILMDWKMPNMNGLEALKRIRANPAFIHIPVVMLTSESEIPRMVEAQQAGASNYILKPFNSEILWEKLWPYIRDFVPKE